MRKDFNEITWELNNNELKKQKKKINRKNENSFLNETSCSNEKYISNAKYQKFNLA